MSQDFLKIIQDGVTSYVPDTKFNREFWAKQNANLGRGRNSSHEIVTITKATAQEVEFMTNPVAESLANAKTSQATLSSTEEQLKNMQMVLENQQALIKMLLEQRSSPAEVGVVDPLTVETASTETSPDQKVTKTENNGKDSKTKTEAKG